MHWADSIAYALSHRGEEHVIASGITPSGEFHIGHLREILTSDIIKRACIKSARPGMKDTKFVFFVDDADPLRKVYSFLDESYEEYIGHQLANIPPPDKDGKPDLRRFKKGKGVSYAKHFLQPFIQALEEIGVEIDDIRYNYADYQDGKFTNFALTAIRCREEIREIIERVSGRQLDEDWFPWNPIDSNGSIDGITVTGWDEPIVSWVDSQGNEGTSDVTKGEGKLPWRIDWPAKWAWRGVTMEPFGKDHGAAGGSYDTGKEICRLFGIDPPYPTTYEWISLKGVGAMSSSTGVIIGPVEALQLVPAEILRFLIARNQPKRHIDFDTGVGLIELADEWERTFQKMCDVEARGGREQLSRRQQNAFENEFAQVEYSLVDEHQKEFFENTVSIFDMFDEWEQQQIMETQDDFKNIPSFRHLALLAQIWDDDQDVMNSLNAGHGAISWHEKGIKRRLGKMRNWIASTHFPEGFRLNIQTEISEEAKENLSEDDHEYLDGLYHQIGFYEDEWNRSNINDLICELAKASNLPLRDVFEMLYWIFLNQGHGPKLASLLAEMDKEDVVNLLRKARDETNPRV
tara:strand:- start:591 stop:2315 length:1725 start_codon:yes stop_codon:yes gene_type:complete